MIFTFLVFFTALTISFIAAWYSIAGLIAIFASAAIPVAIMGSALEVAKLVSASWLYRYWFYVPKLIKYYLTSAVIVLMFITSMGIFGFLSKAHVEQTSANIENLAQVERIENDIARYESIINRSEEKITSLESKGTGIQASVQTQINIEQERIDNAYARIQPLVDEQNEIIKNSTKLYQQELNKIDEILSTLNSYIDNNEIAKAQGIVGTKADGKYGPATAAAFQNFQDIKNAERNSWLEKIQNSSNSPDTVAARQEITRLRTQADKQISESNNLIQQYQQQLQSSDQVNVGTLIDEELKKITDSNSQIDILTEQKYQIESDYRKLEAEVGPIKYIAEFVYGEQADKNLLEKAVKWVIILIIFVFDPLAVLLLIAANMTLINRDKWIPNEEINIFGKKETINNTITSEEIDIKQEVIQELTVQEKEIIKQNKENPQKIIDEVIKPNQKPTKVFLNKPAHE
jgi:peptidoglycan hydrolase-like protein with peptidoglycan-binding domain